MTLAVFHQQSLALRMEEIKRLLGVTFNEVTVYRCLDWLTDNGFLQRVVDRDGLRRWGCAEADRDLAVFQCDACDRMWFMRSPPRFPRIAVDGGISLGGVLNSFGYCRACLAQADQRLQLTQLGA